MNDVSTMMWVGCLGCYNAGRLTGEWIDATEYDEDEFRASLPACLDPFTIHEELWVMDHEFPKELIGGECSPSHCVEVAEALAALPSCIDVDAFVAWVGHDGCIDDVSQFENQFCGTYRSGAEYAECFAEDVGFISGDTARWPFTHIDWDAAWKELTYDGMYELPAGYQVYIFDPNR